METEGNIQHHHNQKSNERGEEALEDERNLLRTLIDNLPDLIYFKDTCGRYILNNLAHLRSIGAKDQHDVLGKISYDYSPPEYAETYRRDETEIVSTGAALFDREEVALHRDTGEQRWHLTSKIPIIDSKQNVIGIVGISRDITEQKRTQETLRHERNLLRTLIDHLPDLIFFKDTEGRYLLNNLPHLRSIGAGCQEEVLGKSSFDYNPYELAQQYVNDEQQVVQTGDALLDREEIAMHKDTGEQRWHLTSKIPLRGSDGNVMGIVGIARDITDRKRAQEDLRRSEERFKQIAESAEEWIWEIDPNGLYTYASPIVEKILGYASAEIVGKKHFYDFFPSGERAGRREQVFALFSRREIIRNLVSTHLHANGSEVILETSGVPILDLCGNFSGYRGAATDITERVRSEKERERLIEELQTALTNIKQLSGLLPICASCKKIRDDKGYWTQVEEYLIGHSEATFTHGVCPECMPKLYPEYYKKLKK